MTDSCGVLWQKKNKKTTLVKSKILHEGSRREPGPIKFKGEFISSQSPEKMKSYSRTATQQILFLFVPLSFFYIILQYRASIIRSFFCINLVLPSMSKIEGCAKVFKNISFFNSVSFPCGHQVIDSKQNGTKDARWREKHATLSTMKRQKNRISKKKKTKDFSGHCEGLSSLSSEDMKSHCTNMNVTPSAIPTPNDLRIQIGPNITMCAHGSTAGDYTSQTWCRSDEQLSGILEVRHNSWLFSLSWALILTFYATPAVCLLFYHLSQIRQGKQQNWAFKVWSSLLSWGTKIELTTLFYFNFLFKPMYQLWCNLQSSSLFCPQRTNEKMKWLSSRKPSFTTAFTYLKHRHK